MGISFPLHERSLDLASSFAHFNLICLGLALALRGLPTLKIEIKSVVDRVI